MDGACGMCGTGGTGGMCGACHTIVTTHNPGLYGCSEYDGSMWSVGCGGKKGAE